MNCTWILYCWATGEAHPERLGGNQISGVSNSLQGRGGLRVFSLDSLSGTLSQTFSTPHQYYLSRGEGGGLKNKNNSQKDKIYSFVDFDELPPKTGFVPKSHEERIVAWWSYLGFGDQLAQTEPHFPVLTEHFSCNEYVKEKRRTLQKLTVWRKDLTAFLEKVANGREAERVGREYEVESEAVPVMVVLGAQ